MAAHTGAPAATSNGAAATARSRQRWTRNRISASTPREPAVGTKLVLVTRTCGHDSSETRAFLRHRGAGTRQCGAPQSTSVICQLVLRRVALLPASLGNCDTRTIRRDRPPSYRGGRSGLFGGFLQCGTRRAFAAPMGRVAALVGGRWSPSFCWLQGVEGKLRGLRRTEAATSGSTGRRSN